jgi:AraC-like DNA-binding protein
VKNDKNVSGIPVILLTALSGIDDKIAGLEVGADYYLEKPFDIAVLKLAIKNLLKRSQLDREINKSSKEELKAPEESLLSDLIDLVHENIQDHNYSIDDLCEELGLSRSNLFRKIKVITGMSISDFIQDIKLNKAKTLLQTEANIRIDHVAYQCGFHDPKYFSTIFKKHFNKTPSEYHSMYKSS